MTFAFQSTNSIFSILFSLLSSSFSLAIKLSQVCSSHDDFTWEQQELAQDKSIECGAHVQV
jgi:hypothetical protein